MVAISLYKGNLHKVPDVPRRWLCPTPKISLNDFRSLIRRRDRTLARLRLRSSRTDAVASSNPNPNPARAPSPDRGCANTDPIPADNAVNNHDGGNHVNGGDCVDNPRSDPELPPKEGLKEGEAAKEEGEAKDEGLAEGEDSLKKLEEKADTLVEEEKNGDNAKNEEKEEVPMNQVVEKSNTESGTSDVEKRKKEVEEKLEILNEKKHSLVQVLKQKSNTESGTSDVEKRKKEVKEKLEVLNEKKHSLVQVLKQILNAEEQLKRQNSMQGMPGRPPLPLQVDTTTDSGSMTRVNTPRLASDGNPSGDVEGGEADDASNHNMHSRHLPRMSSTSPSSDTQVRKPASNMVPHPYRTTLGVAGSPSRFAPAGQGPSVSVSGTSYIASSPSPAASGGTSVFRDGRLPSPWN